MIEIDAQVEANLLYLSDISPRDKYWDQIKLQSLAVAGLYDNTVYNRYGERMRDCSHWLGFNLQPVEGSDEQKFKLCDARFCRVRHCPTCQLRKSFMWQARFKRHLPRIIAAYPTHQFIALMLSTRNCPLEHLRANVAHMNRSWEKLSKRKDFPATGWLRNVEVTRAGNDYAHPHFHVMMMVPAWYFGGRSYLSHARWTEIWQQCLGVDYKPYVYVQKIKGSLSITEMEHAYRAQGENAHDDVGNAHKTQELQPVNAHLSKNVQYLLKYQIKPEDLLGDENDPTSSAAWLSELTKQLHKSRTIALGGVFKKYLSEQDPENLVHSDNLLDEGIDESALRVWAGWQEQTKRYVMKNNEQIYSPVRE